MDNHRVAGLYWEEFATPEQKEAKRKSNEEFRLKYPSKPWTPDEATKERWAREEVMAAEAWAAHKKAYKDQQDSLGL